MAGAERLQQGGARMANRLSLGSGLLLVICLSLPGGWLAGEARAQAVIDEARQAGTRRPDVSGGRRGLFPGHGWRHRR